MKTRQTVSSSTPLRESIPPVAHAKALSSVPSSAPKYRQIYEDLLAAISSGTFQPGERLPSEAELGNHYSTSRITVAKALNDFSKKGW